MPAGLQHQRRAWHSVVCAASSGSSADASKSSLYEVLGVSQSASEREIKSGYRKRALKLHPDVNKAPDAQQRFMEAKLAFETLSDPKQRALYDQRLRLGFGSAADWQAQQQRGGASSSSSSSSSSAGWGSSGFGGYGSGRRATNQQPEDNYTFDDLMRDLDKEINSWVSSKPGGKPKSLVEELEMLGEEFVDFLEEAIGVKDQSKGGDGKPGTSAGASSTNSQSKSAGGVGSTNSSSSSSGSRGPRNPIEEFDELWRKYGEPVVEAAANAASSSSSSSSTTPPPSSSSSSTTSGTAGSKARAPSSAATSSSRAPPPSKDDDIDAMLAELKRKVRKEGS